MNYTQHYQLPQWVETDRILMDDFNDMTSAIDAALKTNADGLAAETAARTAGDAAKGNCQLYLTSYVGTGGAGAGSPCTLTFPGEVHLVLISGGTENSWGAMAQKNGVLIRGGHLFIPMVSNSLTWPAAWSADGKTVSWYCVNSDAAGQLNAAGVTYTVAAFRIAG